MNNKLFIPSCHKFITKKDGTANFQRIYGVLKSAYSTKYPNDTLSSEEVFDFLKLNQIVPHDFPHQDMDFDYQELCFSIITQYKCNSICQLCPYSSLYKNIYENEESILLSYALNSWDHLNSLKKAGLTCRHFRSMIPVSDKSKVLVVPLNRLAYEYLETVPSSANDLLSIDHKIMTALKQNNKNNKNNKIIRNNNSCSACKTSYIRVIALYALPLNLNSLLLHLFESAEAILIPAQLIIYGLSKENAVSTYGIISGMTLPLLLFPSAITNSMSVMLLPKVSEDNSVQRSSSVITTLHQSVNICMHLGIMSCVLFILYIGRLGATLFHEPSVYNYTIMLACICPFLYVKTSLASILNGLNMTARTCAYSITGLAIRIASLILLVPGIGISGYIYGLIISNILVCTLHYIKL